MTVRSADRSCSRAGRSPSFSHVSRNFADVPNSVTDSSAASSQRGVDFHRTGAPSYTTTVASLASADASQFHIIQPVVVK